MSTHFKLTRTMDKEPFSILFGKTRVIFRHFCIGKTPIELHTGGKCCLLDQISLAQVLEEHCTINAVAAMALRTGATI